jgi:hypothetical protein
VSRLAVAGLDLPMISYLFSCDHATCAVPEAYRELFFDSEDVVASAAGWEPGSLNLAQAFAMRFRTPLVHGDVTRLLIDLGKDGDERWSRFSATLPETTRAKLEDRHEKPYRAMLAQRVTEDFRRKAAVIHVLIHTSEAHEGRVVLETPQTAELAEAVAAEWRNRLAREELDARLHRHSGVSAVSAFLDERFPSTQYAQIRLTVSQSFFLEGRPMKWEALKKHLMETLAVSVAETVVVSDPDIPANPQE